MDQTYVIDRAVKVFPEQMVTRSRTYQERKLRVCGVDPARYGRTVETGLFGQDCFKAMTAAGEQLDGMIHTAQRFVLHHRSDLDEPLRQRGWIARDEPGPRGRRILQMFEFSRADGRVAVTAEMHRLVPDPLRMGQSRGTARSTCDPRDGFERLAEKQLQPEDVTEFSADVGNLIHFKPDFARRYGYRAPISQGIQTMIWMMAALADTAPPRCFDVTARFLRPVYWDETLTLWGGPDLLRTLTADTRVAAELRVDSMEY